MFGKNYKLGKQVFISYRGYMFNHANFLKSWLEENDCCKNAILFQPNSLCAKGEILVPYEYIELMEFILDYLARSDAFLFLNTDDYFDSYFTQAEVLQWRRFENKPVAYPIDIDDKNQLSFGEKIAWATLTDNQKKLWAKISVGINRNMQNHATLTYWGKFAKNCFLIPCGNCGEHFLVSQAAVRATLNGNFKVVCPHCDNPNFAFHEESQRGNYYRKPVVLEQEYRKKLRILEADEILALLLVDKNEELPPSIGIVTLKDEKLYGDNFLGMGKIYDTLKSTFQNIVRF